MRARLDIIEALEHIIATRQGSKLIYEGGNNSEAKLLPQQKQFTSDMFVREYSIAIGKDTARIKFTYDYRVEGCLASWYMRLSDIMLINRNAKDMSKILSGAKGNGLTVKNVTPEGLEVVLKEYKKG